MNNFRKEFLQQLQKLDALTLPIKDYVIIGSGPLVIRNLRRANDIDIVVRKNLWDELAKKFVPHNEKCIKIGDIEIYHNFFNLTPKIDAIIDNPEIIDGYPFVTLQDTILWKEFLNREKDQKDIIIIKNFLDQDKI